MQIGARDTSPQRWAGLAGRAQGGGRAPGAPLVFLHGLTFDHRQWDPVLAALPSGLPAIALDLPGHGDSAGLARHSHADVATEIHDAVLDAGLDTPIVVGHAIGGQLATLYAARHPAVGVVSVDAPVRLEPFAQLLRSLGPQLSGDGFRDAWAIYQDSWHMELLPAADRALLRAGDRPGDDSMRRLVLRYQSDLLDRPLEEVLRERDEALDRLRAAEVPYLTLHPCPTDPGDTAWLHERLPQAEVVVWPVGHHFPHLAHPARFAALLTGLAAGQGNRPASGDWK